jgi:hypothetical protein
LKSHLYRAGTAPLSCKSAFPSVATGHIVAAGLTTEPVPQAVRPSADSSDSPLVERNDLHVLGT